MAQQGAELQLLHRLIVVLFGDNAKDSTDDITRQQVAATLARVSKEVRRMVLDQYGIKLKGNIPNSCLMAYGSMAAALVMNNGNFTTIPAAAPAADLGQYNVIGHLQQLKRLKDKHNQQQLQLKAWYWLRDSPVYWNQHCLQNIIAQLGGVCGSHLTTLWMSGTPGMDVELDLQQLPSLEQLAVPARCSSLRNVPATLTQLELGVNLDSQRLPPLLQQLTNLRELSASIHLPVSQFSSSYQPAVLSTLSELSALSRLSRLSIDASRVCVMPLAALSALVTGSPGLRQLTFSSPACLEGRIGPVLQQASSLTSLGFGRHLHMNQAFLHQKVFLKQLSLVTQLLELKVEAHMHVTEYARLLKVVGRLPNLVSFSFNPGRMSLDDAGQVSRLSRLTSLELLDRPDTYDVEGGWYAMIRQLGQLKELTLHGVVSAGVMFAIGGYLSCLTQLCLQSSMYPSIFSVADPRARVWQEAVRYLLTRLPHLRIIDGQGRQLLPGA